VPKERAKKVDRIKKLQEAAAAAAKRAREIAEKADGENRLMTADEESDYRKAMGEAKDRLESLKTAKQDAEIIDQARALAAEIGDPAAADVDALKSTESTMARVKSLGLQVVQSAEFKAAMAPFGNRVPEKARFQTDPISVKSLFTGTSGTSAGVFVTPEDSGILEALGRRPLTIRDVISVRRTGSDTIEYVVQTAHTNNAAPVPEATSTGALGDGTGGTATTVTGGYKPEGSWAFERKTTNVVTIAEWVPATKRALADAAQLEGLINDELRADIAEEEEDQILSGAGTGENLTGIFSTSGIQSQAFDTDIFVSVRRAITKARTIGRVVPNAVALNPEQVETVDLARDLNGGFYGAGPFAMGPRTLWGLPIVESEAIPAGRGLVGDFSKAVLWDREQTTVTMTDSHADFFIRNMVAVLAEERVAFGVVRPAAFVDTDVAA
jgi:HK97 family phage major capsid protein